ncbi:hypothetical protein H0H81_004115 [Sphagnurus paluster]|uniref:Uncharacterized protein n=1 Tax=Sphagnurus paluster TaxID=117069 RepID=A0A9P7KJI2_9AGAR|nr:hypothetical protein H0H81_004115 [Sphagnurus paluster]
MSKFDQHHPSSSSHSRQNAHWYSSRSQTPSNPIAAPGERSSRPRGTENAASSSSRSKGYEANTRPVAPGYSIYQSSKDTYVYEPSLISKSDLYSNSEYDDVSTAPLTPTSPFSPALSSDSTMALGGAVTPEISLAELRSTTPTPSRNTLSVLYQAQTAIRGIFRTQTPHVAHSQTDPHEPSRSATLPTSEAARLTATTRSQSMPSGPSDRATTHNPYSSSTESHNQPYTRVRSPISELSEHGELDRVAKANAQYNAAVSASSSAYYSAQDSATLSNSVAPRQLHPSEPPRRSPEEQHLFPQSPTSYNGYDSAPFYYPTEAAPRDTTRTSSRSPPTYHRSSDGGIVENRSEQFPSSGDRSNDREHRRTPGRRHSEDHYRNDSPPSTSRYVAASRTMPAGQPAPSTEAIGSSREPEEWQGRPIPIPPPRERRTSISQSHSQSTPTHYQSREGGGVAAVAGTRVPEQYQRGSVDREPIYNGGSRENLPAMVAPSSRTSPEREKHSLRRSPPGGIQRVVSTQHTGQVPEHASTSAAGPEANYVSATATREPGDSAAPVPSPRTSPDQRERRTSTSHTTPHAQNYASAAPNGATLQPATPDQPTPSVRRSPEQQSHRRPSTHIIIPSAQDLRPPLRTSPEQDPRLLSGQYPAGPSSGASASNYTSTREASNPPPRRSPDQPTRQLEGAPASRTRRDSGLGTRNAYVRDAGHTPTATQSRHARDPRYSPPRTQRDEAERSDGLQLDVRSSPPRGQPNVTYSSRDANARPSDRSRDRESSRHNVVTVAFPVLPSAPVTSTTAQRYASAHGASPVRPRYNSEQRPLGPPPGQQPPSVSSDPGPARDHRSSISQPQAVPASRGPVGSASARQDADAHRSRTPFLEARRPPIEQHRRRSDGDRPVVSTSYAPGIASRSTSVGPEEPYPPRRYSEGEVDGSDPDMALALFRTVRWNDNLVCPSPIFPHQRRKGWFNRRGDQLWTNEGAYKPPGVGQEYPRDLDDYPEQGEGWMNEEGVRIDMGHRLVPKAPLKSALKSSRPQHSQLEH